MLRVTIDSTVKVAHCHIDRANVSDFARLLQPIAHLFDQLDALFV